MALRYDYSQGSIVDALKSAGERTALSPEARKRLQEQIAEEYYKRGPDLKTFETMLNKLTGSKMQQKGQELAARRGDIYAGGLANMMSNF